MRFYLVTDDRGETLGCETTLKDAHALARNASVEWYDVQLVEAPVNADTIRRLLGNLGGYATESRRVFSNVPY